MHVQPLVAALGKARHVSDGGAHGRLGRLQFHGAAGAEQQSGEPQRGDT